MTLTVELGERSYPIEITSGGLAAAGESLAPHLGTQTLIVTDSTVDGLYGDALRDSLSARDHAHDTLVLDPGEAAKSMDGLNAVLETMFAANLSRSDAVIALGGGVVGDLAGFAAAIYKRGCRFVQIPTTLLAQVDSSVGGKTAINTPHGKNLIGAFYQPQAVLIDTDALATLPPRELKAGYAEVVKYGLLGDAAFFDWLEEHGARVLAGDADALARAIRTSCATKARIVAEDERENTQGGGVRALLNLGHTFAHALELEAGYGDILHGEAVSAGMAMAFEFSHRIGACAADHAARVSEHLRRHDMVRPSTLGALLDDPDALLAHMAQDKKNAGRRLTLILARAIGDAYIDTDADRDAVEQYLKYLKVRHSG